MTDHSLTADATPPSVTVVMAAFNAARTIEDAISSVLSQSVRDIELIVVDDGSSDSTPDLVRELSGVDSRVRLVSQLNAGPSAARNRGTRAARSEIVAFLDSDDAWRPDHLELHVRALADDSELGISFSPCEFIDEAGVVTGERSRRHVGDVTPADLLGSNPTTTCSSLVMRKAVAEIVGYMSLDMKYAEDQEWLFRVACSGWRIRSIEERTVKYRTSPHGLSADSTRMLAGWQRFIAAARAIAPDVVERHLPAATAHIHIYHARLAIRTGQSGRIAREHALRAFQASPMAVVSNLKGAAMLALACAAPVLANRVANVMRSSAHA